MKQVIDSKTASYQAGKSMAIELNDTPREAQNWRLFEPGDDLPEFDYIHLREVYGEVTRIMEAAYRQGFNEYYHAELVGEEN